MCVFLPAFGQNSAALHHGEAREGTLSHFLKLASCFSSSEPVRGAGERGRQVRGGDGPEADGHTAGLRGEMKKYDGRQQQGRSRGGQRMDG